MYVVFDVDSTMEHESFKFYHHAKARADRLNEKERYKVTFQSLDPKWRRTYAAYHRDFYENYVVYWEEKTNLLSGLKFWLRSNTPLCCDPSSETYHSM